MSRSAPSHAANFAARVTEATRNLMRFPEMGRIVPDDAFGPHREVFVQNYRIIYHVTDDVVEIDTVVHGARQLPDLPEVSTAAARDATSWGR